MSRVHDEGRQFAAFQTPYEIDRELALGALAKANAKMLKNLEYFGSKFPESSTLHGKYAFNESMSSPGDPKTGVPGKNSGWTVGFWTGVLWLLYENTGNEDLLPYLTAQVETFLDRVEQDFDLNTHDIGFLYSPSCVAGYKVTGGVDAKTAALKAANRMMDRYLPAAGIFQAWGALDRPDEQGRMIIDCLNNLPLLYWASEVTRDDKYAKAAATHAHNAMDYIVRDDASTFHTFFFDVETGAPKFGKTFQGYSDDSCWARGQSWGIYGFPLSYRYTKDPAFLDMAKAVTNYFLNRTAVDKVAYWDLIFDEQSGEPKDSSASAITVCGLLELVKHLEDPEEIAYYTSAAHQILEALVKGYMSEPDDENHCLLLHGVYHRKFNFGVDEGNQWGDYYLVEALTRVTRDWKPYW